MPYSFDWQYPLDNRPNRIRLADGSTRTAEAITDQMLIDSGWAIVEEKPQAQDLHFVEWERYKGWVQQPIPPKPFDSWVLSEDKKIWEAPIEKPNDGVDYYWNEEELSWKPQTWQIPSNS